MVSSLDRISFNMKLIRAVRSREPIWNKHHKEYKNGNTVSLLWHEIRTELGCSIKFAADRWRNLRDSFKRLYKKYRDSGDTDMKSVRWVHFKQMNFLIPLCTKESSENNGRGELTEQSDDDDDRNINSFSVTIDDPLNMTSCDSEGVPLSAARAVDDMDLSDSIAKQTRGARKRKSQFEDDDDDDNEYLDGVDPKQFVVDPAEEQSMSGDKDVRVLSQLDSSEMFLLSLAPNLRHTPPELLPILQMNLIYVTSQFKEGNIPSNLISMKPIAAKKE